jgi:hypothetical protein
MQKNKYCRKAIHLDFHMPEFPKDAIKNFNAKTFVEQLVRSGTDSVTVFAKDHFGLSFYDTNVGHKHSGLKGDFLGEIVEEAHNNGIAVIAYLSVMWDKYNLENNPDWRQCGIDGKPLLENAEWEWGCINSPYKEESVLPQIREICENYPIDGMSLDIVMYQEGGCHCTYCRNKFKTLYPDCSMENKKLHKEFMARSLENFIKDAICIIKKYRPDSSTHMNGTWELGQDYRLVNNVDLIVLEAQPAHIEAGRYESMSLQSHYARTQGKPFQIITVRFAEGWGEMTLKETEQLKYEFSLISANGGIVCCGDQVYPDGTLEPSFYDRLADAFSYIDSKSEAFGSTALKETAMYHQSGKNFPVSVREYSRCLLGFHKMLVEEHMQYDTIDETKLNLLHEYRLIIIPSETVLSNFELDAIEAYVKNGGCVLFSGDTIWNRDIPDKISNLLGVECIEPFPYICGYYKPDRVMDSLPDMPVLVKSRWNKISILNAQKLANLHLPITASSPPHRGFRSTYPPAHRDSFYPAACINKYGRGMAAYIAVDLATTYWKYSHVWLKQIFRSIVSELIDFPLVITDAPPITEINVTKKDNDLYVHMVTGCMNRSTDSSYAPVEKTLNNCGVNVSIFAGSINRAQIVGGSDIDIVETSNGYVTFTVDLNEPYVLVKLTHT